MASRKRDSGLGSSNFLDQMIYSGDAREKVGDKEMQLLFVLDFLLHFTFDDYDKANTDQY